MINDNYGDAKFRQEIWTKHAGRAWQITRKTVCQ